MITGVNRLAKFYSSLVVLVAVAAATACSDDEAMTVSQSDTGEESRSDAELPVRQWYPTPKTQPGMTFVPVAPSAYYAAPAQQIQQNQYRQQPAGTAGANQQGWQPVPAPAPGNGTGMQPAWQQPWSPAVAQPQLQAVPSYPQYAQPPAWPQQAVPAYQQQGGIQQQAVPVYPQQYYYQAPAPDQYAYRPWGAASEHQNSTNQGKSMNTWQTGNQLPAWGVPGYSVNPAQAVPQYGGYQGAVTPGYVW